VRVILFGASGYTGRLTAAALGRLHAPLVLAGRSVPRLSAVRDELGVAADLRAADATDPTSVAALLEPGDVLVTTVGPFTRLGRPAAQAAVSAGACYLDSTGEPAFLRWMVESLDEPARACGATLLPAFGYDYVPGNLAAALAVETAQGPVHGVRVGYFGMGGGISGGTKASALGAALHPGYRWTSGRLVTEPMAAHVQAFDVGGRRRTGVSVAGSEHLFLPRTFADLDEVGVYLGAVVGRYAGAASRLSPALAAVGRVPGLAAGLASVVDRLPIGSTGGPDAATRARSRSLVVGEALSAAGEVVGRAELIGPDAYDLTAGLLAEGAVRMATGDLAASGGVLGPVEAFGVAGLRDLAVAAGLVPDERGADSASAR
jgi:short subunit dehydrogenase-like uncharacterized protein